MKDSNSNMVACVSDSRWITESIFVDWLQHFNREYESFMVNHPGSQITAYDVVGLYTKAFNRTTSTEKAMNGFKSAGICLMDQDKFKNT